MDKRAKNLNLKEKDRQMLPNQVKGKLGRRMKKNQRDRAGCMAAFFVVLCSILVVAGIIAIPVVFFSPNYPQDYPQYRFLAEYGFLTEITEIYHGLLIAITTAIALSAAVYTYRQYKNSILERNEQRSFDFIRRFNSPEFVQLKADAAYAYQIWVKPSQDNVDFVRSFAFQDLNFTILLKDDVEDFHTEKAHKREISEGLFAILGLLNFFEELAVAYKGDGKIHEICRTRIKTYLQGSTQATFDSYGYFILVANAYSASKGDECWEEYKQFGQAAINLARSDHLLSQGSFMTLAYRQFPNFVWLIREWKREENNREFVADGKKIVSWKEKEKANANRVVNSRSK